jgi:multidrug transporter EmrE-like cation transporter
MADFGGVRSPRGGVGDRDGPVRRVFPADSLADFAVSLLISMAGLAFAMRSLPTGSSYAVWVGIGAALTVGYAMLTGEESASPVKVLLIAGVVGCIAGLKLVS